MKSIGLTCWCLFLAASLAIGADYIPKMHSARAIWPEGREREKNLTVGFRATFDSPGKQPVVLRSTGSSLYRIFLNGSFLGHGPARGPHGFYRVDEIELTDRLLPGTNLVAFEVAGYNVNSYYLLDQPSFLQAEVVAGDQVLASTGGVGQRFEALVLKDRVQQVQRYSFQRPFSEVYRLKSGQDRWRTEVSAVVEPVVCAGQTPKALLPRRIPCPDYYLRPPTRQVAQGQIVPGPKISNPWKDRSLTDIGPKLGGYAEKELEIIPSLELQNYATTNLTPWRRAWEAAGGITVPAGTFQVLDFGVNRSGFIGAAVTCPNRSRIWFAFDEVLSQGDVDFKRLGCVNIVAYDLEPGVYRLESFEPYTLRYLKILVLEGQAEVKDLYLREYVNPAVWQAHFAASDERFNRLFAAGRETFAQNAVDIFMDCPSRERAGWLCDSYFTARVALDLSGNTCLEKNFLENFLLPPKFEHLPEGMLPMCYPADHNDGVYIPNWALWFVLELEEYLGRSGDRALVEALRPRVLRLFEFFKSYQNAEGLLEKLPSWVFVEWSKANDFVQDVNFPSNMLYAKALAAASQLYRLPELGRQADHLRALIRQKAFDGTFFIDNAVRRDGQLQLTTNRTEVGQYFAFYFDVATPETHSKLWQSLVREFGPGRKQSGAHPEIHPANAFIGNVLRLELLSRYGLCQQLLDESLAYQLYMAEQTGTLWENDGAYASCNHGFASHGGVRVLYRDVLGLRQVDAVNKLVQLRFPSLRLDWCEGRLLTPDGPVALRWRRDGQKILYRVEVPAGYRLAVENLSTLELAPQP